jgi:hypothetical protein
MSSIHHVSGRKVYHIDNRLGGPVASDNALCPPVSTRIHDEKFAGDRKIDTEV